jgi:hypothetical protein
VIKRPGAFLVKRAWFISVSQHPGILLIVWVADVVFAGSASAIHRRWVLIFRFGHHKQFTLVRIVQISRTVDTGIARARDIFP